uniref:Uncharacterized protein n=1 Tax=Babesia bovis TaxID=5865 RepID=S6B383_BABBO|nr:hypothetical protein [Babesia bovis]
MQQDLLLFRCRCSLSTVPSSQVTCLDSAGRNTRKLASTTLGGRCSVGELLALETTTVEVVDPLIFTYYVPIYIKASLINFRKLDNALRFLCGRDEM